MSNFSRVICLASGPAEGPLSVASEPPALHPYALGQDRLSAAVPLLQDPGLLPTLPLLSICFFSPPQARPDALWFSPALGNSLLVWMGGVWSLVPASGGDQSQSLSARLEAQHSLRLSPSAPLPLPGRVGSTGSAPLGPLQGEHGRRSAVVTCSFTVVLYGS